MATGKASDFTIYNEEFFTGLTEVVMQNANGFNAASLNAIRLVASTQKGDYEKSTFIDEISSLTSRRDTTSVSTATDLAMTQSEQVAVKMNRKIGPVAQTLDAWRKIGASAATMYLMFGRQVGEAVTLDYFNSALTAVTAALRGQSALLYDAEDNASTKTLNHTNLVDGLAKAGDGAGSIVAWVMHSKSYFDLMKNAISDNVFQVGGVTITNGTVASLGRPIIISDASSLTETSGSSATTYLTLGLRADAVAVIQSEAQEVISDVVSGLENIVMRLQGEYAMNIKVKGMAWDVTNGAANPTDAALGTSTNWDKVATDDRSLPGVMVVHN